MSSPVQKKLTETYRVSKSHQLVAESKSKATKRKIPKDENDCSNLATRLENGYQVAQKALHTSKPTKLPCRESEIYQVQSFIENCLVQKIPGSMYISGAPGTGKTAVVQHVVDKLTNPDAYDEENLKQHNFVYAFINCMSIKNPATIYDCVRTQVKTTIKGDDAKEILYKRVTSKTSKMIVLVLDEMDQLIKGRSHEIIYSLFDWTRIPHSKLVLIGIANSLDLTVRHLPWLTVIPSPSASKGRSRTPASQKKAEVKFVPEPTKLIHFSPYEKADIESILEMRLQEVGSDAFDPVAIKFAAAKVAASTGDMRKALNACKMALEAAEKVGRHSAALTSTSDSGLNSCSPKKIRGDRVGVATISKVLSLQKDDGPLPLQQMIILYTLLRINKRAPNSRLQFDGVSTPIPTAHLYDEYRKVCNEKGFSWIDTSEILSVCSMLQDRSHVTVIENAPGSGTFKKTGVKNKCGILFDPKTTEMLIKNTDLKNVVD